MTGHSGVPALPTLLFTHWRADWPLDLAGALYLALYGWGVVRVRGRWPVGRTLCFVAAVAGGLCALQSGLDSWDGRLLSVHMAQHLLLLLVVPLLLAEGRPQILALRALPGSRRRPLARGMEHLSRWARPWVCLGLFTLVVLVTHLPAFYDLTLRHPAVHDGEHALYLLAGLAVWWPLQDADPAPAHRLDGLGRLVYLLGTIPAMALVGTILNRDTSIAYPAYGPPARALGVSAVLDQQQAGALMWVGGGTATVCVGLWLVWRALVREERRQAALDRHRPPADTGLTLGGPR